MSSGRFPCPPDTEEAPPPKRRRFFAGPAPAPAPVGMPVPTFQKRAACLAAARRSSGVEKDSSAVRQPQSRQVTYRHQPFSSSIIPGPWHRGQSCRSMS